MRSADQVRGEFIEFFRQRGHTVVPSAPVVPAGDPTLLFTNAGMNQFKDVFLGTGRRDYSRAVDSQKIIRVSGKHNDLEEVGRDTYHHTFFEMLGNWSFGDYGKREAITWAWELLTRVWGLPKERLYATVYLDDEEAEGLWKSETDIDPAHIFRFDRENFWEMGETGPCGPSSEIHIDLGETVGPLSLAKDPKRGVNSGDPRFIELWNLVFIRFERQPDGSLAPLAKSHVDTGMGFERILSVLQGSNSNYETDVFRPILDHVAEISGRAYSPDGDGTPHRVIADHVRMLTFSITDGVTPSNEGRGYVARRILRRAARFGRELGVKEPFIHRLVPTVVRVLGGAYPEIAERQGHVMQVVRAEEESFGLTLDRGLEYIYGIIERVKAAGGNVIPAEDKFKLADTYGFPPDMTDQIARERGLGVDEAGYRELMERQREKSRAESRFGWQSDPARWAKQLGSEASSRFLGYDLKKTEAVLLGADETSVVLDQTPFYAESGGQVADQGEIRGGAGFVFRVEAAHKAGALVVHEGRFTEGGTEAATPGATVEAAVDLERRTATARNHTATHLLHRALRDCLGEGAVQAGSLVSPDYLRFDFNHYSRVSEETILEIERRVNAVVREDRPVITRIKSYDQAVAEGATALFGEKYESRVRVVEVEGYSQELCGGTHVRASGEIGAFVITAESSVASGVRRIEALTGEKAAEYLLERSHLVDSLRALLPAAGQDSLDAQVEELLRERKGLQKEIDELKKEKVRQQVEQDVLSQFEDIGGVRLFTPPSLDCDGEALKQAADKFRESAGARAVGLFSAVQDRKLLFVCAVTDDLVQEGKLKAGELVGQAARAAGGGGGGKPHLATAGGKQPEKLDEAVEAFKRAVREKLS
ncbi:alanine--tRNA ligase [bacterium]|nr:alanine--tRNA ligase [bacterium]